MRPGGQNRKSQSHRNGTGFFLEKERRDVFYIAHCVPEIKQKGILLKFKPVNQHEPTVNLQCSRQKYTIFYTGIE